MMDAKNFVEIIEFVLHKVPPTGNRPGGVEKWIKKSLEALQLNYLDLYLIHTPFAFEEIGNELHPVDENGNIKIDPNTNHIAIWAEMEQQILAGRTKAIGLSNFNIDQINRILSQAQQPISNLQIELHAYFQQSALVKYHWIYYYYSINTLLLLNYVWYLY